jgi:hypothetical protein
MALETAVSLRLYEWKQPREETKNFSGRLCWRPYESNPSLVLQSKPQMDADLKDRVFEEFNSLLGGDVGQECITTSSGDRAWKRPGFKVFDLRNRDDPSDPSKN